MADFVDGSEFDGEDGLTDEDVEDDEDISDAESEGAENGMYCNTSPNSHQTVRWITEVFIFSQIICGNNTVCLHDSLYNLSRYGILCVLTLYVRQKWG